MKNILVLCPSAWDREALDRPELSGRFRFTFHGAEFRTPRLFFNAERFIERTLARFGGAGIDGVVGTDDYLACAMAAVIARRLGLPGAPVEAILRCQHKHAARVAERERFPDSTPRFELVAPGRRANAPPPLDFPFFLKPVKATFSIMARRIDSPGEFHRSRVSLPVRFVASRILDPFRRMVRKYTDIAAPCDRFIAEELLEGTQITLEGFACDGEVEAVGFVDSRMYPGTNTFLRFDYPSTVDAELRGRMLDRARGFVHHVGLDRTLFNMEFFHDPRTGALRMIEVNPRMCYQFADLYEKVDGLNTYDVLLALATGERPVLRRGEGPYRAAASHALKAFEDRTLVRFPGRERIDAVRKRFPGAQVHLYGREGRRLSRATEPYVEGHRYAILNIGGDSRADLDARIGQALGMLPFEFA